MEQNRFWFDVNNYIEMVHDEFLMGDDFQTKEDIQNAFWDGADGKPNDRYIPHPALMKAYQKGNRLRATTIEGKQEDFLQDLSAVWGRWSKLTKLLHGKSATIPLYKNGEITGHWVIAESGAASPSHWAAGGYTPTIGYPSDIDGATMATKDYQTDRAAQKMCEMISRNYDERAITEAAPVTVSFDGVVMCGNLRTMAGMLAAHRGTDNAYIDYLRNHCLDYGFKTEDIDRYHHPRLLFMTKRTAKHRYSKEEFERFASI